MSFSSENSFAFWRFLKDQEVFIEKLLNPLSPSNIEQKFDFGNNNRVALIFSNNFAQVKRELKTELMNSMIDISKKHGLVEHANRAYFMQVQNELV